MTRRDRSVFRAALLLAGTLVLAFVGILFGAGVYAVSTTATNAHGARAAKLAQSTAGPTDIDHFACYLAKTPKQTATSTAQFFDPPPTVSLTNQFTMLPSGAPYSIAASILGVQSHCNPVQKTVAGTTTYINHPNSHLLCFDVKTPTQPAETPTVTNQFGSGTITTTQPETLCLPTFKTVVPAGGAVPAPSAATQPGDLDHYLCYGITNPATGLNPPNPVLLQDQFNFAATAAHPKKPSVITAYLGTPDKFCVPTLKTVDAAVGPVPSALYNSDAHLLCYPISYTAPPAGSGITTGAAKPMGTVYDQNQFGFGTVTIGKLNELCVPSFKGFPPNSTPTGTVTIYKEGAAPNAVTGGPPVFLSGATFGAYLPTDTTYSTPLGSGTCVTSATGSCTITGLPTLQTLVIHEVSPPAGFAPGPDQNIVITPPVNPTVQFLDQSVSPAGGCTTFIGDVLASAPIVTSSVGGFTPADIGDTITGTGIPAGTTIAAPFIDATHAWISTNATPGTNVTMTIC